ncbi:protease modulator HflC [Anaplasmataceae bacterium AB001_6]|nr:protease modulator HflC [Anaplasmataceae bacterium AB001_6]
MQNKIILCISSILFIFIASLYSSVFFVKEGKQAIVVQFGDIISENSLNPGVHFKIPFIQEVFKVDSRLININTESKEIIAADQKRLMINYYVKYKVIDQIQFYKSSKSLIALERKINPIVESSVRENVGMVSLIELLNNKRSEVMRNIKNEVNDVVNSLGIEVVDVRIKQTDLPSANSEAIFARMNSEREKEAREIRANGAEEAKKIKSIADRDYEIIIANAKKNEEIIRGQGEAKAADIYNKAYSVDKSFFIFQRKIDAYKDLSNSKGNRKFIMNIENNNFLNLIDEGVK